MTLDAGDRVAQQARSTSQNGRTGVIREVLRGDPAARYRIRWDDGRESVYTPAAGCLVRLPAGRGRRKTQARAGS
jgi:Domain of unknown function (DUF1918)